MGKTESLGVITQYYNGKCRIALERSTLSALLCLGCPKDAVPHAICETSARLLRTYVRISVVSGQWSVDKAFVPAPTMVRSQQNNGIKPVKRLSMRDHV